MGITNEGTLSDETKTGQVLLQNLSLYDQVRTEQLGALKIHKQKIKPYRFIMTYSEHGMDDSSTLQRMQQKERWYRSLPQHPHIVDIELISLTQKTEMCIKKLSLELYARYYNHTLQMGILRKLKRNKRFKEADLFYVLMSLLEIWRHLAKQVNGKYIALFNLRNVYLSPEGYVKMYPFPITLDFVSSPLRPKKSLSLARTNSIVESQEVEVVVTPKKVTKADSRLLFDTPSQVPRQLTEKDSLRDIGVILLQLVLLNKESNEIEEFSTEKQAQLLLHLCSQGLLSLSLKDILMKLLLDYKNTSFNELSSMIEVYRQDQDRPVSTNIKLEDGPEFAEVKEAKDMQRGDKETGRDSSKTHSLKRLGEHGHLRAGSIGVLSKKSSRKSQQ